MPGNPGMGINRYSDLLRSIPRGEFYRTTGIRIPYQGTKPYDLLVQTSQPVRVFGVFVNGKFVGVVTTDDAGVARFSTLLDLGRNTIALEDDVTGQRILTYLDVLLMHTVHAAIAEVVERIDASIQDVFNDRRIEAAERNEVEDVWGRRLQHPNASVYSLEAYRESLQEVHQAYRVGGGKALGLDDVVGSITATTPLHFPFRTFGPRWILGNSFLRNAQFQERNRQQFTRTGQLPGVVVDEIGPANQIGPGTLTFTPTPARLAWMTPGGAAGPNVDVSAGGIFTVPGVQLAARFDGRVNETFAITGGANDKLRLNVDGKGSIDITLTAGAARTAVQIVLDINAAFSLDIRYGGSYATVASVISTTRVRLQGVVTGVLGSIVLENITNDAYFTVFGYPWERSTLINAESIGSTSSELVSSDDFPVADTSNTYKVLMARNTSAREELVTVTANNTVTDVLTTLALTKAKNSGDVVELEGMFPYETKGSNDNAQGVVVTVTPASLPAVADLETITLYGSNTPDFWLSANAAPVSYFEYGFFEQRE